MQEVNSFCLARLLHQRLYVMTPIYNTLARRGKRDNILVSGPITILTVELTLFCLSVDVSIIHYTQTFPFCTISARIFI